MSTLYANRQLALRVAVRLLQQQQQQQTLVRVVGPAGRSLSTFVTTSSSTTSYSPTLFSFSPKRKQNHVTSADRTFSWGSSALSYDDYDDEDLDENADYESPLQDLLKEMETVGTTVPEFPRYKEKYLKCGLPESALRFSTTSYGRIMRPPFVHPNEHRVVLRVSAHKLFHGMDDLEQGIFKEIVGSRFNHDKQELQLQSVQFGSRIENKRHLVSILDRIVTSTRRLAQDIRDGKVASTEQHQAPETRTTAL